MKSTPETIAVASASAITSLLAKGVTTSHCTNEDFEKNTGAKVIKLQISNAAVSDVYIPFGTLLGINGGTTTTIFPQYTGANGLFGNLASITDNIATSAPYIQDLNKMIFSRPLVVSGFEVITDDDALGIEQRKETLTLIDYPAQVEDSKAKKGDFISTYVEVTSAQVLSSPVTFGMLKGGVYKMLALSSVYINITIGAIDTPNFVVKDC